MRLLLILFILFQSYADTLSDNLQIFIKHKYQNYTAFELKKLTLFPILKGGMYFWHLYNISDIVYRNKDGEYIIGMMYHIHENDTSFYVYQAEQYYWSSKWVIKRRVIVGVDPISQEILIYLDEKF